MKRENTILLFVLPIITVCLGALCLMSYPSKNSGNAELRQYFGESSIVVDNHEGSLPVPKTIVDAALMACPLWAHHSLGTWPEYYVRTNGYTCAVWKWPITMWDLELKRMTDEFRVWIKDDTAEIVPTPPFSPMGNPKAKPPRLKADKAVAIAEIKTGFPPVATNVVKDVGAFFRVDFFQKRIPKWDTMANTFSVWVSKSDWTIRGNPFSPIPTLTDAESLSAMLSSSGRLPYDESVPVRIDRVADLSILSLPHKRVHRNGTVSFFDYWACLWIDNANRKVIESMVTAD